MKANNIIIIEQDNNGICTVKHKGLDIVKEDYI